MSQPLDLLRRHLRCIDNDIVPVQRRYREHMACAKGCSDCCHQTFRVSKVEGALLREGLASLEPSVAQDIMARARAYRPDARHPCPVLSEQGACRLYGFRPRICRKYGVPLWHPDQPDRVRCCPKNFQGVSDLDPDLIVEPQARWAESWIRIRTELDLDPSDNATIAAHLTE